MSLKIYLSQVARRAAFVKGLSAEAEQEFKITPEVIDRFFALGGEIDHQGVPQLDATRYSTTSKRFGPNGESVMLDTPCETVEEALTALEELAKARQTLADEKKRQEQAKLDKINDHAQQWLVEWPVERLKQHWKSLQKFEVDSPDDYYLAKDLKLEVAERIKQALHEVYRDYNVPLDQLLEKTELGRLRDYGIYTPMHPSDTIRYADRNFEVRILYEIDDTHARVKALAEQRNREHREQLRRWIVEAFADDPTAAERFDEDLLDPKEIAERLRGELFAPFDQFERYDRLSRGSICHDEDCYGGEVLFDVDDGVDACTATEWTRYKEIEAAAPKGAALQLREHKAECRSCRETAIRNSLMVKTIKFGLTLTREYGLGEE